MTTTQGSWESVSYTLLAQLNTEIEELAGQLLILQEKSDALTKKRDAVLQAIDVYKERVEEASNPQQKVELFLSPEDVRGLAHWEVLKLLAKRNNNVILARDAIKLMVQAGAIVSEKYADSIVYTALRKKAIFEKMAPGVYRLKEEEEATLPYQVISPSEGLVETVRRLREERPSITRSEIAAALIKSGYDFGGNRPISAVSAAWMNLERKPKTVNYMELLAVQ